MTPWKTSRNSEISCGPFRHLTEDPEFRASHKEFSAVILMWIYEIGRCWSSGENMRRMQIIYTSDHGDMLFSHFLTGKGPAPYEENARIPLFDQRIWSRVDEILFPISTLAPAVFEMMGIDIEAAFERKSLYQADGQRVRVNDHILWSMEDKWIILGLDPSSPCTVFWTAGISWLSICWIMDRKRCMTWQEDPDEMVNLIHEEKLSQVRNKPWSPDWSDVPDGHPFRSYHWEDRPWHRMERDWDSAIWPNRKMRIWTQTAGLWHRTGMESAVRKIKGCKREEAGTHGYGLSYEKEYYIEKALLAFMIIGYLIIVTFLCYTIEVSVK